MSKSKTPKKRKQSKSNLANVCNITGFNDGDFNNLSNGDVLDCLEELASAQVPDAPTETLEKKNRSTSAAAATTSPIQSESHPLPPPPPGIKRIPNLKIELARHLQIETLSTFLLTSCKGLRMPTFERWLLDSKLEEKERYDCILTEWEDDPSLKLEFLSKKKKYGRAALFGDLARQKEDRRKEKESRLLLSVEKVCSAASRGERICHLDTVDPILPSEPLESDSSCIRLLEEVIAVLANDEDDIRQRATDIVKELCSRTSEAVANLAHMEMRLGKYQKFGWDSTTYNSSSKKKRRKEKGSSADKVTIEWNDEHSACSLMFIPKKKRSDSTNTEKDGEDSTSKKPKPFVVKLNALHYHKLRSMFDKTYSSDESIKHLLQSQIDHVFHSILFAMIIRYSSLSGGQQLNDLRGGGMQGAIHNEVFNCFGKWFGTEGVECFASPFNCHLSQYYSAFSSPDIDGHFGSYGDFFYSPSSVFLREGWYELNPPFSPGVMDKMAARINDLMNLASKQNVKATFVIIVPTVHDGKKGPSFGSAKLKKGKKRKKYEHKDENDVESNVNPVSSLVHKSASTSFDRLVNNHNCTAHIILPANEHGYVEGSQHLRPTKYKESKYSTSVIVLRTQTSALKSAAVKKWDAVSFEKELREAFASRHKSEIKERKSNISTNSAS